MEVEVCFCAEIEPDDSSKIISFGLGKKYTHVLIKFTSMEGVKKVFHSVTKGVSTDLAKDFYATHYDVLTKKVELNCTPEEFKALTVAWNGVEYGYWQFSNCIFDKIGLGFINFSENGTEEMICSELVARVLIKWTPLQFKEGMDSIDPEDVEDVLFKKEA